MTNQNTCLLDEIRIEKLKAFKNRDSFTSVYLGVLLGEVETRKSQPVHKNKTTQTIATEVLTAFVKGAKENLKHYANYPDKLECFQKEIELCNKFLPKQLTKEEILTTLQAWKTEGLTKPLCMQYLKQNFAGLYDGKEASEVVDSLISKG